MDKRTYTIYPLPLVSRGYKKYVPYQILFIPDVVFLEGGGGLMKRDQREKRYFYKICRFFFNF
jgi:hypothetical protein